MMKLLFIVVLCGAIRTPIEAHRGTMVSYLYLNVPVDAQLTVAFVVLDFDPRCILHLIAVAGCTIRVMTTK